jgi:hypothetical protein
VEEAPVITLAGLAVTIRAAMVALVVAAGIVITSVVEAVLAAAARINAITVVAAVVAYGVIVIVISDAETRAPIRVVPLVVGVVVLVLEARADVRCALRSVVLRVERAVAPLVMIPVVGAPVVMNVARQFAAAAVRAVRVIPDVTVTVRMDA